MDKSGPNGFGSEATIHLVLHLNPNVQNVLGQLPSLQGSTATTTTPSSSEDEEKRHPSAEQIATARAQFLSMQPSSSPIQPRVETKQDTHTPVKEPVTTTARLPRDFPEEARDLFELAEMMVGALGQGDVSAIWREPDRSRDGYKWQQFIDPKFQSCIAEALVDLSRVSSATIWQVVHPTIARTHFLQFIKYEYSVTKLAMKGTYRQLDAKSDLTDAFKNACEFFKTWRP